MKCWILYIVFVFTRIVSSAQDPVYRSINNLNGLPSNTVYNVLQDKQGFIWIAHDKGLTRYDGKQYKNYYAPTQQGRSLSNIKELQNTIWCQDFAGNFYYTNNDSLQKETRLNGFGAYIPAVVLNSNIIAVANYNGVSYVNTTTNKASSIVQKNKGISSSFSNGKVIMYASENQLYEFDGKLIKLIHQLPITTPIFYFLQQIQGNYFGITKDRYPYIHQIEKNNTKPINVLQPGLLIQDVSVINNEIWISTSTGAYCFDTNWKPQYNGMCFLKGNSISKVIKDRESNYWFSTLNKGIIVVPEINTKLSKYNDEAITSLASDGKNIIAGTANNNILYFNEQQNSFSQNFKGNSNSEIVNIFYDSAKKQTLFSSNKIYSLNSSGIVTQFASTAGKCVITLDEHFYVAAYSGGVSLLRRDNSNAPVPAWLKAIGWTGNHYPILDFATRGRWVLYNSKDSILYAATSNGLYFFSPIKKGKITIAEKDIYASQLLLTENGMYASTFSDGLIFIDKQHKAIVVNNKNINKTIYKIKQDGSYLWMLTDGFLQKYNIANNTVTNYTYADGLPKAEIKDLLLFNKKVFLATSDGLVVFNDKLNSINTVAPNLLINQVLINNEVVKLANEYQLSSTQNNIDINFSLLSFRNSDNAEKIEYKINNGNWQSLTNGNRTLSLPSLAPGTYLVSFRAFNEDGVGTNKNIQLLFSIAAPFYKRTWFVALMVLSGMALVFTFFMFRVRNIQQKNELLSQKILLEQELQQSLLSSIKSQMNPHFLFNALNTIQSYIYTNDKENASQYLGKFSTLTRMILDMSNKEIVALSEEIKAINLYLELEKLRFEDKLLYHFSIDNNISTETTFIPSMIIQPFIENAIKHGLLHKKNDWLLNITFNKKDNQLVVCIDDNGIGRKRSEELNKHKSKHQSFASNANQKRLAILNKGLPQSIGLEIIDKADAHGNALGTSVIMYIPFSKK